MSESSFNPACRHWLPETALAGTDSTNLVAETARQWSAKWLARSVIRPLAPVEPMTPLGAPARDSRWSVLDDDMALAVPEASTMAIAALMLDAPAGATFTTAAERRIAADLAHAALDDLRRRLTQAFRLPADASWTEPAEGAMPMLENPRGCPLGVESDRPLVTFVIAAPLLARFVKARLPSMPRGVSLPPIATALGDQMVEVAARLGRSVLTLADLAGLAIGDVVVLDRAAGTPADLMADRAGPLARCAVELGAVGLALKLLDPLDR